MRHFLIKFAALGAAAATLAACASTPAFPTREGQVPREPTTPNFPITQAPEQPAPPDEVPSPAAQPSAAVESSELAPLEEAVPPPPPPPPEPVYTTRTVTAVTGKVVEAEGKPVTYTVQSGDGLDAIARKLGTNRKQLADDNDLEPPYRIKPGQKLQGPAPKGKAYVVGSGDTLYAIAQRFSVKAGEIAEANDMELADTIRPGQKLLLPQGFKDSGPITRVITERVEPPPQPVAPRPTPQPVAQPPAAPPAAPPPRVVAEPRAPAPQTTPQPAAPPAAPTSLSASDAAVSAAGRGRFQWPVKGEVISTFGPKGVGQQNDGLNIKSPAGAPVKAAADGEVVYAGDQVPGFGNLVLVKHEDGWVTAYAHLSRIDVSNPERNGSGEMVRQAVRQGEVIGAVGSTGGVAEPQLHFEVRYAPSPKDKARPIDPALVLPR